MNQDNIPRIRIVIRTHGETALEMELSAPDIIRLRDMLDLAENELQYLALRTNFERKLAPIIGSLR